MSKKALVLGANGLIGSALTRLLLSKRNYEQVHIAVRRQTNWDINTLIEHIIDFNQLSDYENIFQVHDVFCCLGTTIKKAKTKEAFYLVDHDYVVEAGELTAKKHATFLVVSSMGANPTSLFFYNRVKGQMENALQQLPLPSLHIFRPSLLLGERSEVRVSEKLVTPISKLLLRGPLRPFKPIHADTVANAMIYVANNPTFGNHIYSSEQMEQIVTKIK